MLFLNPTETTSFNLVEERSYDGAPIVAVTFPDGYKDTLVLSRFYANEKDRTRSKDQCNYIGHLENEVTACAAMTGCVGIEDVEFTILSTHASKNSKFKWTKEGNVETFEVNIYYQLIFIFFHLIKQIGRATSIFEALYFLKLC